MLDSRLAEARLGEPAPAVGAGVIEAAAGLDEHVEAHEQAEGVLPAVVVNDAVVYDDGAARRKRIVRLGKAVQPDGMA